MALSEQQKQIGLAVGVGLTAVAGIYLINKSAKARVPKAGPYTVATLPADAYDALLVGGGPSGSTCAFYMARAGAKVLACCCDRQTRLLNLKLAQNIRVNGLCQSIPLLVFDSRFW